ncbi:hypothetical protein CSUI_010629 [Cystoisospora suis]|uniref:Transmembrane protein n=1 Tax=Cystoisospora suis TaxID=483139 RepID=A0A2C6KFV2_9APIC|nr:hypothetical protein CSUI_010629 [Cystoisospora suis]
MYIHISSVYEYRYVYDYNEVFFLLGKVVRSLLGEESKCGETGLRVFKRKVVSIVFAAVSGVFIDYALSHPRLSYSPSGMVYSIYLSMYVAVCNVFVIYLFVCCKKEKEEDCSKKRRQKSEGACSQEEIDSR